MVEMSSAHGPIKRSLERCAGAHAQQEDGCLASVKENTAGKGILGCQGARNCRASIQTTGALALLGAPERQRR